MGEIEGGKWAAVGGGSMPQLNRAPPTQVARLAAVCRSSRSRGEAPVPGPCCTWLTAPCQH